MWMIPDRSVSEKGCLLACNAIFDIKFCLKSAKIEGKIPPNSLFGFYHFGGILPLSASPLTVSLLM